MTFKRKIFSYPLGIYPVNITNCRSTEVYFDAVEYQPVWQKHLLSDLIPAASFGLTKFAICIPNINVVLFNKRIVKNLIKTN